MLAPSDHPAEAERLALLVRCGILDTAPEPDFDNVVDLAAAVAGTPVALISLVDAHRQWFKARHGLDATETPRSVAFCAHAILQPEHPLIVEDALSDPRFADNPLVGGGPRVVFYVGIPLRVGSARLPVGTLCVIDSTPRQLPPERLAMLTNLGRQAEMLLDLRLRQRQMEDRLVAVRASEERVQAILGSMDEGLVVQDRDGSIRTCNAAAERILGLTRDQLAGRTSLDPLWQAVRSDGSAFPGVEHPAMQALRSGQRVSGVIMGVGTSEHRRWILINAQPIGHGDNGLPESVVTTFTDITALRREEAERRRAEEQVQQFFVLSLEMLAISDTEGRFLRVNPTWTKVLGWTESELLAQPISDLMHPDDRQRVMDTCGRLIATGGEVACENRCRCRDGSYRTLAWSSTYDPSIGIVISVVRDVTAERAVAAELLRAKEAAEAADRAKSEFLATMSHEIRTPMNGVMGLTEVLSDTKLDDQQRSMLASIRDSGRALLSILNDILDWSRIEAGRMELEIGVVDATRVIRDVITVLRPQAQGKGIGLVVEGIDGATHLVLADAGRLRQVLFNLVGNAIKFTVQGQVTVRVLAGAEGRIRFAVSDTGIGMSAEQLPRLFQRFSQVDSSSARRFGGSGLGLAISRHLAQAMSGSIAVESQQGHGSTFTVDLPAAPATTGAAEAPAPSDGELRAASRPLHLLVVEDNPVNQRVALALLQRDGHQVELANNGIEAVAACRRSVFDAVLMDVQMPEMDGLEATRVIRAGEPIGGRRLPIIALTASAMNSERDACLIAGMDQVVAKPVTGAALREALGRVTPS